MESSKAKVSTIWRKALRMFKAVMFSLILPQSHFNHINNPIGFSPNSETLAGVLYTQITESLLLVSLSNIVSYKTWNTKTLLMHNIGQCWSSSAPVSRCNFLCGIITSNTFGRADGTRHLTAQRSWAGRANGERGR